MIALLSLFLGMGSAHAACAGPTGATGAFSYNTSALQYCDGTNWLSLGSTNTGTTCTTAGEIRSTGTDHQYCNGTNWISTLTSTNDGACSVAGLFMQFSLNPEFCNGTNWLRLTTATPTSNLLLKAETGNASTTIADSSTHADNLTAFGNAKVSTAQSKFGTGSLVFDASSGTYIGRTGDTNLSLGSGDFTVEAWVRLNAGSQTSAFADFRVSGNTNGPALAVNNGKLYVEVNGGHVIDDTVTMATNTWIHIAMVRYNSVITLYKNGAVVGSSSSYASQASFTGAGISIGTYYETPSGTLYHYNGYIDNLRVVSGIAAYTSAFTPPVNDF